VSEGSEDAEKLFTAEERRKRFTAEDTEDTEKRREGEPTRRRGAALIGLKGSGDESFANQV